MTSAVSTTTSTSLKTRAINSGLWSIGGHGAQQVLRLGSNLVLTRLLFPEVFGLMALVQAVLMGINMFSDIGLNAGVIRSKHGDEERFLNTAWTIQVIRGVGLWIITCIAALPAARFYEQAELMWLLPAVGLSSIAGGLSSTSLLTLKRDISIKPLIVINLASQLISLGVMVVLAIVYRSVWALVVGGIVRASLNAALSYRLPALYHPRFVLNRPAALELIRFGRWLFVGTALTFLLQQGDRLVLGKVVPIDVLGIYGIATFWSRASLDALLNLNGQVLFPVYSKMNNEDPSRFRPRLFRARLYLLAVFLPILCLLVVFGRPIVGLLYDDRYIEAGWMLQILAAGSIGSVISATTGGVLLAVGDSFRYMVLQIARGGFLIAGMVGGGMLGVRYFGEPNGMLTGVIVGMAASRLLHYPVLAWGLRRHNAWLPKLDLTALGVCLAVCVGGLMITGQVSIVG